MYENENYETEAMEAEIVPVDTEDSNSGLSTGVAVAIGAGLALAGTAVVKLVKKAIAKHKAKKELRMADQDELVEPTEEQVMEVTK